MRPVQAKAINLRPDIDPNTRLYVPFNEGLGSIAKDYSQYGNHAVLTDVEWGIGVNGNAGVFNGVSSFANCGNHPSLNITDAITIVARVKGTTESQINKLFIWKLGAYGLGVGLTSGNISSGKFGFNILRTFWKGVESTTSSINNIWYHVVGTFDGTVLKIYLNGILENTTNSPGSIDSSVNSLGIGATIGPLYYFNGTINEVMIYNLELSAAQNAADCYEVVCN